MSRPLIITDCDEVLLHMVVPFRHWLDETHDVHFDMREQGFAEALRHKDSGIPLERELVWELLIAFFDTEMARQTPISGAVEALHRLAQIADIGQHFDIGDLCQPSCALFIDDLGEHHASVARHAPGVWRLHMVGEPEIAGSIPVADKAHARIDDWASAEKWIIARLAEGPAPAISTPLNGAIA